MSKDIEGHSYLKIADAETGQRVELDGGFTCIKSGSVQLLEDNKGLYFLCDNGRHYIEGQTDDGIYCVGIYKTLDA